MSTQKIKGPESQEADATESRLIAAHDRNALLVGRKVLSATGARDVILFGSRARGDYRDDSDIDLLVILPGLMKFDPKSNGIRGQFERTAHTWAESLYEAPVMVQLVWYSGEEFDRFRRSLNHVTAIASREGISMNGSPASDQYPDEGDYAEEWNITLDRCRHARIHLQGMTALVQANLPDLLVGQQAQQTQEHAIKGLISANGRGYRHIHDLVELERDLNRADREFGYSLQSPLEKLSLYAGGDIYRRAREENPLGDSNSLLRQVEGDVQHLFQRIAELTGRDPWQDQP